MNDLVERIAEIIRMSTGGVSTGAAKTWTYEPPECGCEEVHRADCPTQAPQYTFEVEVDDPLPPVDAALRRKAG